jgi:hypothetical protein
MPLTEGGAKAQRDTGGAAPKKWPPHKGANREESGDRSPGGSACLGEEWGDYSNPNAPIEVYRHRTGAALSLS